MTRVRKTPPFLGPDGEPLAGSIAEAGYLRLGSVDQWVMIRGESVANPPLILLHGGPGLSETFLFRHFTAPLEKSFTLVYWDQRGAGKSFDEAIPGSSMTAEQLLADLDELVEHVRARLGRRQVVIFGHSWGAVLGVLYAARFPDKVAAYVGSGQIGDWAAAESASYAFAVAEAVRLGSHRALRKLRAIGPPPYDADAVWTERVSIMRLEGQLRPKGIWKMARSVAGVPEASPWEFVRTMRVFRKTFAVMWPEVSRLNLLELAPVLAVPVYFFLGRRDRWVPPETSLAYYDALRAPAKKLLFFEKSGHEPFADEAEEFNRAMVELVRPVAVAADDRASLARSARLSVPSAGRPAEAQR
jgi:pimeloyl-ACP methyl ester carboxylesterase